MTARSRVAEPVVAGGAVFRYVESSALIAAGMEGDVAALQSLRGEGTRVVSALTLAEARRTLTVARAGGRITLDQHRSALEWVRRFERRCQVVDVSSTVLARVGRPFPIEPVRARDAIHLATIEMIEHEPALVAVVTRDRRIADNARAMGYLVE